MAIVPERYYMTQQDWDDIVSWGKVPCERCGTQEGVELEDSRTAYAYESPTAWDRIRAEDGGLTPTPSVLEDPNKPVNLCRACAKEHHDYWDEMWREYYGGLL
jgi:hypothetical protein